MNVQQANFIKDLVKNHASLNEIAEKFYSKYGETVYCKGPTGHYYDRGKKIAMYSSLDGNDLKNAASEFLHERL